MLVYPFSFQYHPRAMVKRYAWVVLILFIAASFRVIRLTEIPPGLTHDEADHGLDAWGVLNGIRPIYFTTGYGREPLFDYATAGLMSFLGPSFLAGRLTSAFLSLLMIAATMSWAKRAFNSNTALLTGAGLAIGFWAVMTGRQSLRSATLPTLFAFAILFFWWALEKWNRDPQSIKARNKDNGFVIDRAFIYFALSGVFIGLSFYSYLPARVMWLLLPIVVLFLILLGKPRYSRSWQGLALSLLIALLIALPLFVFLINNPEVEIRVAELSEPIRSALDGNFRSLTENLVSGSLSIFVRGDDQWRYNIPGKPFLPPVLGILFLFGLGLAGWYTWVTIRHHRAIKRGSAAFLILIWLLLGISPIVVTGASLGVTQAIGIQPILYLFPALALTFGLKYSPLPKSINQAAVALLFLIMGIQTVRDYFFVWATEPEVQVQYESSLVTAIDFLNKNGSGQVAISTTTPNQFHSPAVALLTLTNPNVSLSWFDGRHSLLLPAGKSSGIVFTEFADLSPYLGPYFAAQDPIDIPEDMDQDLSMNFYELDPQKIQEQWLHQFSDKFLEPIANNTQLQFDDAIELLGYDLQTPEVYPGETFRLATLWRVNDPLDDAAIFTHLLGDDGKPLAQDDRLDVPSHYWQKGDLFIQLHQFDVPESAIPGAYPLSVGIYFRDSLDRLPVVLDGEEIADQVRLPPLVILP